MTFCTVKTQSKGNCVILTDYYVETQGKGNCVYSAQVKRVIYEFMRDT